MKTSLRFPRFSSNYCQGSKMNKTMKALLTCLIVMSVFQPAIYAQTFDSLDYNLSNPYSSVTTHLKYLQDNSYSPEISAKAFEQEGIDQALAKDAAIKLKQVLDGEGIYVDVDLIPKNPNHLDSATNSHRYILTSSYPTIYLQKYGQQWLYSKRSIEEIEKIHNQVFKFGVDKLLELAPKLGPQKMLGLHVWQIVGILIIVIISVIAHRLFTYIIEKVIIGLMKRQGKAEAADKYIRPMAKPISYLIIFPILILFVPVLQLPVSIGRYVITGLKILWPIILTVVCYRLVDFLSLYFKKVADKTESTLDDQLVPLVRKILKAFVIVTGALFVLLNLNISIIPFITGLSIGGLAFALAAQDTIKNFFGSLMIFIDKPFQVGHWITSGEIDGDVEEVGLRSTRVRTFRDSLVYVPNGVLADRTIDNHGLRAYRRYYAKLGITYDTPPDVIRLFIEGLKRIVKEHPHTRKDKYHIYMNEFGSSSLNIMLYIFFKAPTWGLELQYRHEVILSIVELAEKLNVRFAFPTQTLHMETFPEKESLTPDYGNDMKAMRIDMDEYFKSKKKE